MLALRRSPDRVGCRGGRVGRNRPIFRRGWCHPLGASSARAPSGNPGRVRCRRLAQAPRHRHGLSSFQRFVRGFVHGHWPRRPPPGKASARRREAMMLSDPPERCHPVARRGLHGSNLPCCLSAPRRSWTVAAWCPGPVWAFCALADRYPLHRPLQPPRCLFCQRGTDHLAVIAHLTGTPYLTLRAECRFHYVAFPRYATGASCQGPTAVPVAQ
jgi:hypothetical protein